MSTVKVQGNASGTGSITLASPNTNNNRTINLPDVDGSFVTADSNGNVGVGITPSAWGTSGTVLRGLEVGKQGSGFGVNTSNGHVNVSSNAYYDGGWKFAGSNYAVQYNQAATSGVHAWYVSTASGTAGNAISFTQAMTLDASGNLLVGTTTSSGSRLTVNNNGNGGVAVVQTAAGQYSFASNAVSLGGTYYHAQWLQSGTAVGSITSTGSSTSYNTSSDYRLKENIAPMTGALSVVAQLKPVTYTWKADGSAGQGFIAHELQEVVPDCVTGEKDAVDADGNPVYQGIDTSFLVATLTAAIQEQQVMIEEMKAEIAALKGATQ